MAQLCKQKNSQENMHVQVRVSVAISTQQLSSARFVCTTTMPTKPLLSVVRVSSWLPA
jgi:hypothetical protein